ncbi:hypothetical protein MNBD_GAMMA16-451 [hydrothermal vent metagenome]|uniref:Homolog of E. coli HemX protein n=1 Tax=hydrothermal vent metagenome TaxID=652676 RepID=A0A3B0ZRC5_9ZZZZ
MNDKSTPEETKPTDSTTPKATSASSSKVPESTSTKNVVHSESGTPKAASKATAKPTSSSAAIAAPKRPDNNNTAQTSVNTSSSSRGGNGLATAAIVLALVSVAGGYMLWSELANVQRELAGFTGLDKSELDRMQTTLDQNSKNRTGKAAAELKTLISEAQRGLESEMQQSISSATDASSALSSELQKSLAQLENNINNIANNIKQQDAKTAALVAATRGQLQNDFHQATAQTNGSLAELKGSFGELKQQVQNQLDSTITDLDARLKSAEKEQTGLQLTVERSAQELAQAVGKNRADWALNEVEHILSIANNQVLLERSPLKAVTSLRTADQRLQRIKDPLLAKIRDAISTDIAALENVKTLDLHSTSLTINRLAGEAGKLRNTITRATPAAEALALAPDEASIEEEGIASTSFLAIKGFASAAWQGLSAGVTIADDGEIIAPLLPPEHAFFLQQNLQLKLESARLALVRQDDTTFHSSITAAKDWTQRYFDAEDATTQQFIKDLNSLDALKLDPTLPDISSSLTVLREIKPSLL